MIQTEAHYKPTKNASACMPSKSTSTRRHNVKSLHVLTEPVETIRFQPYTEDGTFYVHVKGLFNAHSHTPEGENPRFLRQVGTRL